MNFNEAYTEKGLIFLKQKYNYYLGRSKGAEEYFKNNNVSKCMEYLDLFNEVTRELSKLIFIIESVTNEKLDYETKINGFKEVRT